MKKYIIFGMISTSLLLASCGQSEVSGFRDSEWGSTIPEILEEEKNKGICRQRKGSRAISNCSFSAK